MNKLRNFGWVVVFATATCSRSAKKEAASLVAAVDRFRMVANAEKPGQARVISDTHCQDPEVCDARNACVVSSAATARALVLKDEVEKGLVDLHAHKTTLDDAVVQELPKKLDEAEALLTQGHAALSACEQKTDGLRRKYSL